MSRVIESEKLSFEIDGKELISNISLYVENKEFVGLIGPNGSGKSTLLKNIYKQHRPSLGNIWIQSQPIESIKNKELAKILSVVTQENRVEFDFAVDEMMSLSRLPYRSMWQSESAEDRKICEKSLKKVGMDHMAQRSFLSLSGGEKQRVLLAMAFAQETDIIILDEPTNHIDIGYQLMIMEMLKKEKDMTIFTSFHNINLALKFCDRILVLNRGKLIRDGKPETIITEELLKDVFQIEGEIINNNGSLLVDYKRSYIH